MRPRVSVTCRAIHATPPRLTLAARAAARDELRGATLSTRGAVRSGRAAIGWVHPIGLRRPSLIDLTHTYYNFGIDYIYVSIVCSSSIPSLSTTRIFSDQRGCRCVTSSGRSTAARVFASPLHLHRGPLCIDDCASNLCCAICLHKVFVLLIGSSLSSCRYLRHR